LAQIPTFHFQVNRCGRIVENGEEGVEIAVLARLPERRGHSFFEEKVEEG